MLQPTTEVKTPTRYPLTTKQQGFFQRHRQMALQIEAAMKGALQLIIDENDIKGRVTVSDDGTELIIEEE
jgi:hypothetical protein